MSSDESREGPLAPRKRSKARKKRDWAAEDAAAVARGQRDFLAKSAIVVGAPGEPEGVLLSYELGVGGRWRRV